MRSQRLIISAMVLLGCTVGVWLQWAVLIAVSVGMGLVALLTVFLRFPSQASWTDIDAPVRLSRQDEGLVRIRVNSAPGPGRWLSAAASETGERVFVDSKDQPADLCWAVDTSKRGVQLAGPTVLEAVDPFGVRRRVFSTRERCEILIVPKVTPIEAPETLLLSPDSEESMSRGSDAFESLREYVTGDPLKLVHWKATARAGQLMVRRNVDTHIPRLLVVLDLNVRSYDVVEGLFSKLDEQAFERAVDLAASVCWHACTPAQRVLLTTNGSDGTSIDIDIRDRESMLDWLATVQPSDDVTVGNARLGLLIRQTAPRSAVFISGPLVHVSKSVVQTLRQTGSVTVRRVTPS